MSKKERRRVSKEQVRENARKSGAGGKSWFTLPDGVRQWAPEKSGTYLIDILPYEVKSDAHPDRIEAGMLWYKMPFQIHHGIGANSESIVCPATLNRPCPICKERQRMAKGFDNPTPEQKEELRQLTAQRYMAFNVIDPDDKDKVAVFAMSTGKFWEYKGGGLKRELEEGDESILNFYDTTADGKTLKVRFSEEEFAGNAFLQASRFDFTDRDEMDEDETLAKTVCLDSMFNDTILPYDQLKALFLQVEAEKPADDDEPAPKAKAKKPADDDDDDEPAPKAKAKKLADDDDDDDDEKPEPKKAGAPKFKVGQSVNAKDGKVLISGTITEIDDEDITIEDKKGKEHIVDVDDVQAADDDDDEKPAPKTEGKKPADDDDDDPPAKAKKPADDDDDEKPAPKAKAKKPADDDDDDEEDDEKPAAKTEKAPPFKEGDKVQDTESKEVGTVLKVKGDDITVQMKAGKSIIDVDDLKLVADEPAPELKAGDKVTWDDGDESGTVVKVHSSGEKVKVSDANDNESWQPIGDVVLVKKEKAGKK